ncbi:GOLPH3/VPS74 family protein [Kribbella sindirgiensis]|uniref:GPP34 family phosphoprotein n=1 Tax=Kribbella sindirgiensis TaxID=1124744 RepID=A0A4V2M4P5_9ACTN|nr:GPP34 family phosphoprotein [Kribbella sindirgiensis]TCC36742.1 GPP34 family phosphoprotein [Kribbella sindirgiensis]
MSRAVVTPLRRPERSASARQPARPRKTVALGNAAAPDSLAARLFLLAYDPERGRLTARSKLGKLLRAAILVDLQLSGHLEDDNGRARLTTRASAPVDPVVAGVLAELRAVGPRRWRRWIDRRGGVTVRQVRDELARAHLIRVEPYRVLGIFPSARITLRHPLVRRHILQSARDTLRPSRLVSRVDLRDAAIVVLASTADLRTVVTKDQRTRHKDRLAQLAVRVGPVVPALKKSLQQAQAAAGG